MRSVLCTRIVIPLEENVSNSILRAVLRGNTHELMDASKRKRLKGATVALTADDRCVRLMVLPLGFWQQEVANGQHTKFKAHRSLTARTHPTEPTTLYKTAVEKTVRLRCVVTGYVALNAMAKCRARSIPYAPSNAGGERRFIWPLVRRTSTWFAP